MPPKHDVTIELQVDRIAQLFETFDPLPYRERDLDADAEEFITGWARDLPRDEPIEIVIHAPKAELATEMAKDVQSAFRQFFLYRAENSSRDLREMFRVGRIYLLIGLVVLASCVAAGQFALQFLKGDLGRIASEGLFILGWVANWKPIETFLFDWLPLTRRRRLYQRLAQAKVSLAGR